MAAAPIRVLHLFSTAFVKGIWKRRDIALGFGYGLNLIYMYTREYTYTERPLIQLQTVLSLCSKTPSLSCSIPFSLINKISWEGRDDLRPSQEAQAQGNSNQSASSFSKLGVPRPVTFQPISSVSYSGWNRKLSLTGSHPFVAVNPGVPTKKRRERQHLLSCTRIEDAEEGKPRHLPQPWLPPWVMSLNVAAKRGEYIVGLINPVISRTLLSEGRGKLTIRLHTNRPFAYSKAGIVDQSDNWCRRRCWCRCTEHEIELYCWNEQTEILVK